MNNNELDQILKSAATPERPESYWQELPKRITAKLQWQAEIPTRAALRSGRALKPLLAWGLSLAAVCIGIGFLLKELSHPVSTPADNQLAGVRKCFEELEALFPNQLRGIVFDSEGPRMILADRAEVPNSAPVYLKVCGPKGCAEFITFSGQQIGWNGENFEVLADAQGGILLVGNRQVLSQGIPSPSVRLEAKLL